MGFQNTMQNRPSGASRKPIPKVAKPSKRAAQKAIAKKAPVPRGHAGTVSVNGTGVGKAVAKAARGIAKAVASAPIEVTPNGTLSSSKRSNRKVGASIDPKSSAATVEKLKRSAKADKKKHGAIEQAATPKKPSAKQAELDLKAKKAAAMHERASTVAGLTDVETRKLVGHAAEYFEAEVELAKKKPAVLTLRGMVQQDTEEVMRLSKEAESLKPDEHDITKRLGSVGKDLRRRKDELAAAEKSLQGIKDRRKGAVEGVMEILRDTALGGRLFQDPADAATAGQQVDREMNGPAAQKGEAPAPANAPAPAPAKAPPSAGPAIALEVGSVYRYQQTKGEAAGKVADVKVLRLRGTAVSVEVVLDPGGTMPVGHQATFDVSSGTWTRVEAVKLAGEPEPEAAAAPALPAAPPGPTIVKAPPPSWHRRTVEETLEYSIRPAALHALKQAGKNTIGDLVEFELGTAQDGSQADLTDIRGITAADAANVRRIIAALADEYQKGLDALVNQTGDAPKGEEPATDSPERSIKEQPSRRLAIAK